MRSNKFRQGHRLLIGNKYGNIGVNTLPEIIAEFGYFERNFIVPCKTKRVFSKTRCSACYPENADNAICSSLL